MKEPVRSRGGEITNDNSEYFIINAPTSIAKRASYFALTISVLYLGMYVVNPLVAVFIKPFLASFSGGPKLLFGHLFKFSLTSAAVAYIFIFLSARNGIVNLPSLTRNFNASISWGLAGTLILCIFTVLVWVFAGGKFQFTVNFYSIFGNIFSNLYEEVVYRALLLPAALLLLRNKWLALLVPTIIMAATHANYPWYLQLCVGLASLVMSLAYYETGNLFAPWLIHQLSDMVLDSILKQ